jgi:archaellum biogenesis ATPase FlaH
MSAHLQAVKDLSELRKKELEVKKYRTDLQYQEIVEVKEELRAMTELDITNFTPEFIEKLINKSEDYFKGSKKRSEFIVNVPEFNAFIPFFPKNLIVIGAVTGEGKSTCCANLAYTQLLSGKRPLIITNEESAEDVYNRVASMFLNIRYGNHDRMTDDQINGLHDLLRKLASRMHVIDNAFGTMNNHAIPNVTTTIEGLDFILKQLVEKQKNGFHYDCIIIDYFQNFNQSRKVPSMDIVKVLTNISSMLDQFKNHYNAPIVVLAQLKANSSPDKEVSAKERLEWCKGLINKATCFVEMKAVKKDSATMWIIHKSRWNDYPESVFVTGWDKGRYVPYTEDFKKMIINKKLENLSKKEASDGTQTA